MEQLHINELKTEGLKINKLMKQESEERYVGGECEGVRGGGRRVKGGGGESEERCVGGV